MQLKSVAPTACAFDVLDWAKRVHVVGVAGSGLRGMVHLLHQRGAEISGSELSDSPVLEKFRSRGIDCRVGHTSGNVRKDTSLVLVSAAVTPSNPEVTAALSRRIPVWKYSECLGRLMAEKVGIAVAGTHGKTTTTAMVTTILKETGNDPTFLIGGEHPRYGSARWGSGAHFVAEACEFDRSFLNMRPRISLVTNIEADHLDYFGSLKEVQRAFADFVALLPEDGFLAFNRDDANSAYLGEFCRSKIGSFGMQPRGADLWAADVQLLAGESRFVIATQDGERVPVSLPVAGEHNVRNALAAALVCRHAGVALEDIAGALAMFTSVKRRFEILARGPLTVVDDYAHHPTEIDAVLSAARKTFRNRRLIAVFQPHQHSRLRLFQDGFARVLSAFDRVVVTDVYRSRDCDEDARTVRSEDLVAALRRRGTDALHAPGKREVLGELDASAEPGDVVLFLGAGDVTDMAHAFSEGVIGGEVAGAAGLPRDPQRVA